MVKQRFKGTRPLHMRGSVRWVTFIHFTLLLLTGPAGAQAPECLHKPGALVFPDLPAGTPAPDVPIEHILVLMQENRSFDHYFGMLNDFGYEGMVDGLTPEMSNPDAMGQPVRVYHEDRYCVEDTAHSWNGSHRQYHDGVNDGFVVTSDIPRDRGRRAMGYYTPEDLPYYYALANTFAIGDRYFCSLLGPTYPNRFYLLTGTSFGHIRNSFPSSLEEFSQPTIFDLLDAYGISWKYYFSDVPVIGLFLPVVRRSLDKIVPILQYYQDLGRGRLPQVAFIDPSFAAGDEHPPHNIQIGQFFVSTIVNSLIQSSAWPQSALFVTYDEHGGLFDHVPPPPACAPDDIEPMRLAGDDPGAFDRYGFRVPVMVISPYAKRHFVSHEVYDHTSILRFVQMKWNLPSLTRRDANARPMLDFFDFGNPQLEVPRLPAAVVAADRLRRCLEVDGLDALNARTPEAKKLIPDNEYWRSFSNWFYNHIN